jgi:exosortase
MTYSPPPFINYILWVGTRRFLSPFIEDGVLSPKGPEKSSPTLGENTWEKNPTAAEPQTRSWFAALSLSVLVVIMYAPVLTSLARQWWDDPNYGHGFLVPLFAAYVLWSKRDQWRTLPFRPNNSGFAIMLFAIALRILGMLGAELFLTRVSLVVLISGMVLFLAGSQALRWMAFPLGYLLFMIPLPAIVYYQLTLPLQLLASRLGSGGLVALGIHTVREGNVLILPNCTLNVVEACSGIRSLLSLLAAVVAFAYLAEPTRWKRGVLAVASIPIAIATNGLRLVATGVLSYFFTPAVDSGVVHMALGLGFFAMAFLLIVLVHKLLQLSHRVESAVLVGP